MSTGGGTAQRTFRYRGYVVDTVVGQISGAVRDGLRFVAVAATYSPMDDQTLVTFAPLPLGEDQIYRDPEGQLRIPAERIVDGAVIPRKDNPRG